MISCGSWLVSEFSLLSNATSGVPEASSWATIAMPLFARPFRPVPSSPAQSRTRLVTSSVRKCDCAPGSIGSVVRINVAGGGAVSPVIVTSSHVSRTANTSSRPVDETRLTNSRSVALSIADPVVFDS